MYIYEGFSQRIIKPQISRGYHQTNICFMSLQLSTFFEILFSFDGEIRRRSQQFIALATTEMIMIFIVYVL